VLHYFAGGVSDGAYPYGTLINSGSTLFGVTYNGGSANLGTVFRINTDSSGFQILYSFSSPAIDGTYPNRSLLLSGSNLYGTASCSNNNSYGGTLFRIGTDGTGFQVLFSFYGSNGMWPYHAPILSGSTLYGMCTYGGNGIGYNGDGTIYRINTDGTGFELLHTFAGEPADGSAPHGLLLQSGSTFYSTTPFGGANGNGVVFKVNIDGTGYQLLYQFQSGGIDGSRPGSLIQSGETLYGMASSYGSGYYGTIYKINTDGTGFQVLHTFTGGSGGTCPLNALVQAGSVLYGMTRDGGSSNLGTIFQINIDGTGFQVLHNFNGTDGSKPYGSLILSGTTLYGMASSETGSTNMGVIFALDVPVECVNQPESDLNGDCKVDFQDLAILADEWLDCGLEPAAACDQ
jgi:uncharacterized repeat protein (TIGR03803 family)